MILLELFKALAQICLFFFKAVMGLLIGFFVLALAVFLISAGD